ALVHDVLVTIGVYAIFKVPVNAPFIAAMLTIIGYSINDTIVIFDRIRENMRKNINEPVERLINRSINEVLSRTIITSLTTLFAALALYLFGGPAIHDFSLAIIIGIVIGTYSSIFVASPVVLLFGGMTQKK
ncbi:MAG: protein translocase subunit SecF, partial [Thermodesulfovibrionales bacterium]|nr:protein translocase subunit SecF [Thermodesulfovibrionales bacterium]